MRIFWQCVWEADVYLVVQLTEDISYIPLSSQEGMEFGHVSSPANAAAGRNSSSCFLRAVPGVSGILTNHRSLHHKQIAFVSCTIASLSIRVASAIR